MKAVLDRLKASIAKPAGRLPPARHTAKQPDTPAFDVRAALHAMLGVDLTQIHGLGPALALKLVGECGTNLAAWPSAKHFTSWLCLAPSNKISGGKLLSSRTRGSGSRAAALLRRAAVTVGRHRNGVGRLLSPPVGAHRQGEGRHRHRTQDRCAVLQHPASRHGLRGSRRGVLRGALPATGSE